MVEQFGMKLGLHQSTSHRRTPGRILPQIRTGKSKVLSLRQFAGCLVICISAFAPQTSTWSLSKMRPTPPLKAGPDEKSAELSELYAVACIRNMRSNFIDELNVDVIEQSFAKSDQFGHIYRAVTKKDVFSSGAKIPLYESFVIWSPDGVSCGFATYPIAQ